MNKIGFFSLAVSTLLTMVLVFSCSSGGGNSGSGDGSNGELTIKNPPNENVAVVIKDYSESVMNLEQFMSSTIVTAIIGSTVLSNPASPISIKDADPQNQGKNFERSGTYLVQITTATAASRIYDRVAFSKGSAVIDYNKNYYDPIRNEYVSGSAGIPPSSSVGGGVPSSSSVGGDAPLSSSVDGSYPKTFWCPPSCSGFTVSSDAEEVDFRLTCLSAGGTISSSMPPGCTGGTPSCSMTATSAIATMPITPAPIVKCDNIVVPSSSITWAPPDLTPSNTGDYEVKATFSCGGITQTANCGTIISKPPQYCDCGSPTSDTPDGGGCDLVDDQSDCDLEWCVLTTKSECGTNFVYCVWEAGNCHLLDYNDDAAWDDCYEYGYRKGSINNIRYECPAFSLECVQQGKDKWVCP
jgi:hypothetical protein